MLLQEQSKSYTGVTASGAYEKLFRDLASPISQLILQEYLASQNVNSISTRDILVHVETVIEVLKSHGMAVTGQPGDVQSFDPNWHEPVAVEHPTWHQPVRICIPGIALNNQVLRRALVESLEDRQ